MSAIEHGTRRGFQQHKAVGGMPCEPCRDADRAYMRDYMRGRYDPAVRRARHLARKARLAA